MGVKKSLLILFILAFSGGVFASFNYNWNDIQKSYSAGDIIKGNMNISFSDEFANSMLSNNLGDDEIKLSDFLEANGLIEGTDYNCTFPECVDDYVGEGSAGSFSIDESGKLIGFIINNKQDVVINSMKFGLQSGAAESCYNQINVDVLNNEKDILGNYNYLDETCFSPNYGCFEPNLSASSYESAIIESNLDYCERFTLSPAPAYKLGARIENSSSVVSALTMSLYDSEGNPLIDCELPEHTTDIENLECIAEYASIEEREYFVCVSVEGVSDYKIRSESNNACGTLSPEDGSVAADYEIFVKNMKFGGTSINVDNNMFGTFDVGIDGTTIEEYVDAYIEEKYNRDCEPQCVIPIKLSGISQSIIIPSPSIELLYGSSSGSFEVNSLFNLGIDSSKLNSEDLIVDLRHANFKIPLNVSGSNNLKIYLGNDEIFGETINVTPSFDFDLNPKFVAFGQIVTFEALTSENITSSIWNFGDGENIVSEDKTATHQYLSEGTFDVEITLTRDDGIKSTRNFEVIVGDAESISNSTIALYKQRIEDIKDDILIYPEWVRKDINMFLNLSLMESRLNNIEDFYLNNASTGEDYNLVMTNLIDLNVPVEIKSGKKGSSSLLIGFENVDVSYIEELSNENVPNQNELKGLISSWMIDNLNARIETEQIDAFYGNLESETLVTRFKISTNPQNSINDAFLILGGYSSLGISFKSDYGENIISGVAYIPLASGSANQVFEFVISDDVEASELGIYISPKVGVLGDFEPLSVCNYNKKCEDERGENKENCSNDCRPWGWFNFWIVLLIIVALVVYIIMQEWYKKHYEKSLFKNDNDLYNIVNFIYNSRKAGFDDSEIKSKLRSSSWSGERIRYAFRKLDGRRTGMFEIPIFKFIENKKVKKELTRRQKGRRLDVRFIKRPRFWI